MTAKFSLLHLMPEFLRELEALARQKPALRRRTSDVLESMGADLSQLDRKRLEAAARNVWRTKAGYSERLIDEPLGNGRIGETAILYIGQHDQALKWGERYAADTEALIGRQRVQLLTASAAANQVIGRTREPEIHIQASGLLFSRYLTRRELARLGINDWQIQQILAREVGVGLSDLGLEVEMVDRIENLVYAKREGRAPIPAVPAAISPTVVSIPSHRVHALLRMPLHKYLATMSEEQRKLAYRAGRGLYVVRGAAGSGKTIVGIRRLEHMLNQRDLFDKRPVLFTCFNKTLKLAAEQMIEASLGRPFDDSEIVVRTVHELFKETMDALNLPKVGRSKSVRDLLPQLQQARAEIAEKAPLASWSDEAILEEIVEVIFGRAIMSKEIYTDISLTDRTGRGRGLDKSARESIWRIYRRFRDLCDKSDVSPWSRAPAQLVTHFAFHPQSTPRFSGVVVDEVQDLSPAVIRAIVGIQAGVTENILLLGDAAQTLYQSGFRWKHLGLELKGRFNVIKHCFRSTAPIVRAASPLIANQSEELGDDLDLPEVGYDGDAPTVTINLARDAEDALLSTATLIADAVANGTPLSSIGVLIDESRQRRQLGDMLAAFDIPFEELYKPGGGKGIDIFDPSVKLLTTYSAKGLEFPVVFLPLITEEQYPTRDVASDIAASSRRKIYTAMLRCAWELHIGAPEGNAAALLRDLEPTVVKNWPSDWPM
jgi:hypothetical protein